MSQTYAKCNSDHHHILGSLSRFPCQTLKLSWTNCDSFLLPSDPSPNLLQPRFFLQLSLWYKLNKDFSLSLSKGNSLFVIQLHLPSADNASQKSFLSVSGFICFNLSVTCLGVVCLLSPRFLLCSPPCPKFWCVLNRQVSSTFTGTAWKETQLFPCNFTSCLCFPVKRAAVGRVM